MKVAFATLGCKVNHYETEAMRELFTGSGWECVPFPEPADVYVVNTCTVTGTGDSKSRQLIARAHRAAPDALIVVTGCYAQTAPEAVSALEGVGLVVGTDGREQIVRRVEAALAGRRADFVPPLGRMRAFEELSATRDGRTRAVLKIQDGCVNFCSYCIIPYARGPLRSRPLASIRRELTALGEAGYREVILTGIHLASWGIDSGEGTLADVLVLADGIPGIRRVRLGSLEPTLIDEAFMRTVSGLKTTCGQFHLSLQSGSDAVLRRMNRRYTVKEFARSAELIRAFMPGAAITTDVIAGFAGETEEEHRETMRFLEEIAFARIHVFPFSVRKGTAAEKMPGQLPRRVREKRAAELIRLGRLLEEAYLDGLAGKTLEVLAESDGTGYSREYARVRTDAPEGGIVRILAKGREGLIMYGEEI